MKRSLIAVGVLALLINVSWGSVWADGGVPPEIRQQVNMPGLNWDKVDKAEVTVDPTTGKKIIHIWWQNGREDVLKPNSQELRVIVEKPKVIEADSSTYDKEIPTVKVVVREKVLNLDPPAYIESGRTLVPMRVIFEALRATVTWDAATQTVTGTREATTVKLMIGSTKAWVNDREVILDVPAKLVHDRTFVPARFVAEALGAKVTWDGDTQTVVITDAP